MTAESAAVELSEPESQEKAVVAYLTKCNSCRSQAYKTAVPRMGLVYGVSIFVAQLQDDTLDSLVVL